MTPSRDTEMSLTDLFEPCRKLRMSKLSVVNTDCKYSLNTLEMVEGSLHGTLFITIVFVAAEVGKIDAQNFSGF